MVISRLRSSLKCVLCLSLLFWAAAAGAQSKKMTATGQVVDQAGKPLPGVSVMDISSGKAGTTTNANGNFILETEEENTISFSFLSYETVELRASLLQNLKVTLKESSEVIDDVVVIGYGTARRRDLTGSVESVKSADLMRNSPVNIAQGLQGKMAGVQITQSDGAPGASQTILIRGANSFSTNSEPLYILDGVPFEGNLSSLNPNDIESVEALKDASATAIYGSRGANGVIIITTKKNTGTTRIEFSSTFSVAKLNRTFDVLDGVDYAYKENERYRNQYEYYGGSLFIPFPENGEWYYLDPDNFQYGRYRPAPEEFRNPGVVTDGYGNSSVINNTNWIDVITRLGFTQQYDLSLSGGNNQGSYGLSFGYLNQQGTLVGTGYERYSGRFNFNRKIKSWFDVGTWLNISRDFTDIARDQIASGPSGGIIRAAIIYPTDKSTKDIDDLETLAYLSYNPASYVKNQTNDNKNFWLNTSSFLQFQIMEGLRLRQNIGWFYQQMYNDIYYSRYTWAGSESNNINGLARRRSTYSEGATFETILTYDKTINKIHRLNAVGGFTYERRTWGYTQMEAQNFSDDQTGYWNMDKGTQKNHMYSDNVQNMLVSLLGRVNYTLMDKYLFTATFRRDGSSKFAKGNKFANFVSGAVAWRASEEKFIKDLGVFHNLKLRASIGQTGNQGIGAYETLEKATPANVWINNSLVNGMEVRSQVDPSLKWETTTQYDVGLDMAFLKGRVELVVDYYHKKTNDLLQNLRIPFSSGYKSVRTNFGNVTNEGVEITGNFIPVQTNDWVLKLSGNLSFNRNRINGLKGDQFANQVWSQLPTAIIQKNGYPIGTLYGYVVDGFYNSVAEVKADPMYSNLSDLAAKQLVGEYRYRDLDHDGKITENGDMTVIGDVNPKAVYGITTTLVWKKLTFSFFLQGVYGNDILNGNTTDIRLDNLSNMPEFMYKERWTPEAGNSARWPKLQNQVRSVAFSNVYVEDGSYLRLKNVSIGYDFPDPFGPKGIRNINVTVSGQNLFTWTNYSWYDPDVSVFGNDIARRGVDMYSYPTSRIFTFSLKMTF